jgi:hypothetical protein
MLRRTSGELDPGAPPSRPEDQTHPSTSDKEHLHNQFMQRDSDMSVRKKVGESWFRILGTKIFSFVLFPQLDLSLSLRKTILKSTFFLLLIDRAKAK